VLNQRSRLGLAILPGDRVASRRARDESTRASSLLLVSVNHHPHRPSWAAYLIVNRSVTQRLWARAPIRLDGSGGVVGEADQVDNLGALVVRDGGQYPHPDFVRIPWTSNPDSAG
jgi:hypothetical protein